MKEMNNEIPQGGETFSLKEFDPLIKVLTKGRINKLEEVIGKNSSEVKIDLVEEVLKKLGLKKNNKLVN